MYECCISFDSYIKPQLKFIKRCSVHSCISFDSYIKPQLRRFLFLLHQVVYLLIPTSNHNLRSDTVRNVRLYIFWFLHQTTTEQYAVADFRMLYIFWFLHQTTTSQECRNAIAGCISFDSYIKPQLRNNNLKTLKSCISFDSYIKPQPPQEVFDECFSCISFDSYIKPQLSLIANQKLTVVYLLIPTSNHNRCAFSSAACRVVYLLIPTSNHNCAAARYDRNRLYIFWFLHQTTTGWEGAHADRRLYIFWFLHQTTTG